MHKRVDRVKVLIRLTLTTRHEVQRGKQPCSRQRQ